jgi:outer membrane protein assembly factor BamE (lipoprotein component of BamABCDE complex)
MRYRNLLLAAAFASGLAAAATIAIDNGIAVKESDTATPTRGMTMNQVAARFGAPVTKIPAVGKPPISRWEYPSFIVYFEADHVIHSVVPSDDTVPAGQAPASDNQAPASDNQVPASDNQAPAGENQAPAGQSDAPPSAAPSNEAPAAAPNS